MKRKLIKHIASFVVVSIFVVLFAGSDKKPYVNEPPGQQITGATFTFYYAVYNNYKFLGDTTKMQNGMKVIVNVARMYISGMKIKKIDSSYYSIPKFEMYCSTNIIYGQRITKKMPKGTYIAPSFIVGLPSDTNSLNPNSFPMDSSDLGYPKAMWFGNTSEGYIFLDFEGLIDTSAAMNGTGFTKFSFKIGAAAGPMNIVLPNRTKSPFSPYVIDSNSNIPINIFVDFEVLFNGLIPQYGLITDTYTINPALAKQVAGNVPGMFIYYN